MNKNFVIITSFISFIAFSSLLGCDNQRDTGSICKKNPELCSDLHADSWCRYEKADLIRKRFKLKFTESPTGKEIYQHLLNLEKYNQCIELAAGVQHILHPERTNDRLRAFGLSAQSLSQMQDTTKESKDLYLAFYHWTRFSDLDAEKIVLTAQSADQIDDIVILSHIASYYQKFDAIRAISIYLEVLDMSNEDNFNPDWLLGLANSYQRLNDFELTYLLSRANVLMTDQKVSEDKMLALIAGDAELSRYLDKQADELVDVIEAGDFKQSAIKAIFEREAPSK
ncbi:DUF2989 domain-containing protein [Shewanella eurypsychrophilus]|uniref:DUF2989 domain-containing protein n=1 Tax=Shewanella eurypsychrophilus TaxID=2593656 RepID=A0ABX6V8C4_9GAMM|nr:MULTISPECIES: DUF2989 domain-containing protein [Shewanella]QFU22815.1 DUF2989 domain-containing protein [Shewanella sp. YLB-09]QPG58102.1 DUF2989 domain-containing protein [Shewanella eurypsychrophilus]